jgi:hypothetical protein
MSINADLHPGILFNLGSSYWQPCTLHAGVKLEVFTALAGQNCSLPELAEKLECNERGLGLLLNALAAMGLVIKNGANYCNAPLAEAFLVKDAPEYAGHIIMHHHHLLDGWAQLDVAVKTGQPAKSRAHDAEKERESFLMGMFNLASTIAPTIAKTVDLSGRRHLLDLGGGPGTYAVHFCQANPSLHATVFDRPTTRPFAEKIAKLYKVESRIEFAAGDFLVDPIPGQYDVAWLSHILHSNTPEECRKLLQKTFLAIKSGGLVMIHDFYLNDTLDGPLFPALFSLNMLINNNGRSYSEAEIREMMSEIGLADITRLPFQGANDSAILAGIKQ